MKILCSRCFPGQPELDIAATLWSFIANADQLTCVRDGDAIQIACLYRGEEVPLAEVGSKLWRRRGALGEVLAGYAPRSRENYRSRLKVFAGKEIRWMGDGMDDTMLVFSRSEADANGDDAGFWSNEMGWTNLVGATRYTKEESATLNLPMSQLNDARWVNARQAYEGGVS